MNDQDISLSQQEPQMPASSQGANPKGPTHRKIFPITLDLLCEMLKTDAIVKYQVMKGLPRDARIVDMAPDMTGNGKASLLVESEEFDLVDQGKPYPLGDDIICETIK